MSGALNGMRLIVSVDTEGDEWDSYRPTGVSTRNIERIPGLQAMFDGFGVTPTYLLTYPVATGEHAAAIFREIAEHGKAEIGNHCHPWNTPPFEEENTVPNTMLSNLPEALVFRKIEALHQAIEKHCGVTPTTFRSGRWGYGPAVARALVKLGYTVDSSCTPYTDWRSYFGPDFSRVTNRSFRFSPDDIFSPNPDGPLWQVPATVGYCARDLAPVRWLFSGMTGACPVESATARLLVWSRMLTRTWLCPEVSSLAEMTRLAVGVAKSGQTNCLTMMFHSTSLVPGMTPFTPTQAARDRLLERIKRFLEFALAAGAKPATLSEAAEITAPASLLLGKKSST